MNTRLFYDQDYFEGRTRQSPPHTRALIYPFAVRTARFLCRQTKPSRVVDVGCAKGYLLAAFNEEGVAPVIGLDISLYALAHSDEAARGRVLVADLESGLPLKAASCDLLTALDLFEHLRDPMPVLHEVRRVLCEDGKAYVKICHPRHPNATRDPSHINVQPLSYWTRTFRETGFRWKRVYEADVTGGEGRVAWVKGAVRRAGRGRDRNAGGLQVFPLESLMAAEQYFWNTYWQGQGSTVSARTMTQILDRIKFDYLRAILPRRGTTLEVGCGSGRLSCWLALAGYQTACLDFSPNALQSARANYAEVHTHGAFLAGRCDGDTDAGQ